jgi:uncharacterized protein YndB with AHSA1/START domain
MPITFSVTEHFNAPNDKIFDALTDYDGTRHWMKGFVRIEKVKNDKVETGSVWRATRKLFGREATEEFEALKVIPGKELIMRIDGTKGSSGKGEYIFQYLFEPKNSGTDVTMTGEIKGLKGFQYFIANVFKGMMKKSCAKDLHDLRAYLNA